MSCVSSLRLVVVPMKDPSDAKTRLSDVLDPARRADLATRLFCQTLQCLSKVQALVQHRFDIATVTASPTIAALAKNAEISVIHEGSPGGLNAAVSCAAHLASLRGYTSLAVLPGDLAAPTLPDLLQLLDRDDAPGQAVICPSSDGGTNALILPLPAKMRFRYGPGSARGHAGEARAAGLRVLTPRLESLRHDVDRRENLARIPLLWPQAPQNEVRP